MEGLNKFKSLVGPSPEPSWIAGALPCLLPTRKLRWLEIGCADGRNLEAVIQALPADFSVEGLAIDPMLPTAELRLIPDIEYQSVRLEDVRLDGLFDVIQARHSLYYVNRAASRLRHACRSLVADGVVIVTYWAAECAMAELNRRIASSRQVAPAPPFESLIAELEQDGFVRCMDLWHRTYFPPELAQDIEGAGIMFEMSARTIRHGCSEAEICRAVRNLVSEKPQRQRVSRTIIMQRRPIPERA